MSDNKNASDNDSATGVSGPRADTRPRVLGVSRRLVLGAAGLLLVLLALAWYLWRQHSAQDPAAAF